MKLYVFETIQPDHIFAVVASSQEEAIKLVNKEAMWTTSYQGLTRKLSVAERANISVFSVGAVFHRELRSPHVMGG